MGSINIGLDEDKREAVAEALINTLSDTYALYMKTHAYHWNVTGPQFQTLHVMFEEQYREMWAALDEIAERIRALGVFAPNTAKAIAARADVGGEENDPPSATDMVKNLLNGHEALIRRARAALEAAGDAGDVASEDLLTVRIQTHEKTAWMLRSLSA